MSHTVFLWSTTIILHARKTESAFGTELHSKRIGHGRYHRSHGDSRIKITISLVIIL